MLQGWKVQLYHALLYERMGLYLLVYVKDTHFLKTMRKWKEIAKAISFHFLIVFRKCAYFSLIFL